jgi:hypothetical protein
VGLGRQDSLSVVGTPITLGTREVELVPKLQQHYRLRPVPDTEQAWIIESQKGPTYEIVGSVAFKNGRLTSASKDRSDTHDQGTLGLVTDLASVLKNLADQGYHAAEIRVRETYRGPGVRVQQIESLFGAKRISLPINEGQKYGNSVSLQEIIGEN